MENASRALTMAATVLIGLMIVSVFVAVFMSFSNSSTEIEKKMAETQIKEFNARYEVYRDSGSGLNADKEYNGLVNIYDIISIINFTYQTNHENYTQDEINNFISGSETQGSMPYYVTVEVNFGALKNKKASYNISDECDKYNCNNNGHIEEASSTELNNLLRNIYYDTIYAPTDLDQISPGGEHDYILNFKCTDIEYNSKSRRVVKIKFEFVKPTWW